MKTEIKLLGAAIFAATVAGGCAGFNNGPAGPKVISLWTTTSTPDGAQFTQADRLARPAVNEVFATVAGNHHEINDLAIPTDDHLNLTADIEGFLTSPCGRSPETRAVIKAVLVPDVLKFDVNSKDAAAYLGVETGGATGGKFGGRKLEDDVIDISLGIIFGNTISALGLAPDDGAEIPTLLSDHVDASGKHFSATFPYIGRPN